MSTRKKNRMTKCLQQKQSAKTKPQPQVTKPKLGLPPNKPKLDLLSEGPSP